MIFRCYAFLVLRLSKIERGWQSRKEAVISLRKEAKTLQALEAFDLPFEVPRLVCLVRDDSAEPVGLIESAVSGRPLLPGSGSETSLEIIANVAGAIHNLPKTDFPHLKMRADSGSAWRSTSAKPFGGFKDQSGSSG
jgi:hypothetical protein